MDAFYASVEQLDRPDLRGKPVIVGADPSSGRGVVSAASYEAREFGVRSAMPIIQAFRACPHGNYMRPRFARYKEISDIVFDILREYSPSVEPLSIDEAFVDLTGTERLHGSPESVGRAIKARIFERTGLVASVGIAPNKFLAKLASDHDKPDGFVVIYDDKIREFLDPLPIGRLWGVGPATERTLLGMGIVRIGDLLKIDEGELRRRVGDFAVHFRKLAMGEDDRGFDDHGGRGGMSIERTYLHDEPDLDKKIITLRALADKLSVRIRKAGVVGKTITVKVRHADFTTITRAKTLPSPVKNSEEIYHAALKLAEPEMEGAIRLLGIRISNFVGDEGEQLDLFASPQNEKIERLERALDDINQKFGDGSISRAKTIRKKKE